MTFWRINSYFGAHVELEIEGAISSVAGFTLIWIGQLVYIITPMLYCKRWVGRNRFPELSSGQEGGGVDSGYEATLYVSIKIW